MDSIPHDDHRDYGSDPALAALRLQFPEPWKICFEPMLGVYSAELRSADGRYSLHYLAGQTVGELRARLETATAIDAAARR